MSLDFFRKGKHSIITMLVFGVIILTFIFWGTGRQTGRSSTTLTTVNGEPVSYREFQRRYNQQLEAYGKILGPGKKVNKNLEKFIEKRVAMDLITRKLISQEARKIGIVVGKEDILSELQKVDAFHDPDMKRFSPRIYKLVLDANGMKPKEFEESLKEQIEASRYSDILASSVVASRSSAEDDNRIENFKFDLSTAVIKSEDLRKSGKLKISDDELKKFYEERKAEFLSPEKRVLEIARYSATPSSNNTQISEDQVKKYFEDKIKNSDDKTWTEERARALHILIAKKDEEGKREVNRLIADLTKEEKKLNASELEDFFRQLAESHSEDYASAARGGDLGYFGRESMVENFSKAVFNTKNKLGSVVGPVETDFGYHIIMVLDRTGKDKSLANREKEIRYKLQEEVGEKKIKELKDWVASQLMGTKDDHKEWFEQNHFSLSTTSPIAAATHYSGVPSSVINKSFEAPVDQWQEAMTLDDQLFVYRVKSILPPEPEKFEEARAEIERQISSEKAQGLVEKLYTDLNNKTMSWATLKTYGAELKSEKAVKAYEVSSVPGFSESETLLRTMQSLTPEMPITKPILNQGSWIVMKADNFSSTGKMTDKDLKSKMDEEKIAMRGDLLETKVKVLMKKASIPEDFRKEYGI